jgi:PKD repeat protein
MIKKLHIKLILRLFVFVTLLQSNSFLFGQNPNAGFIVGQQSGCAPFSVNFTNTSTGASTYQWNFGNGNFSSLPNPQNVYVAPGDYTVSLIAIAQNGNRDTLTINNYISALPGPVASFTSTLQSGCMNQTSFSFTNTTPGTNTYFWDFGDGTYSLQSNPNKVYNTSGNYTVSMLATNTGGCEGTYQMPQNITVHPITSANFSASPTITCNTNQIFQFAPQNTNAGSYLWDFGDGTTSIQQAPSKTYSTHGIYNVKLKITNSFGCVDSVIKNQYITIYPQINPQIIASDSSGCAPQAINFTTNVQNASLYSWNFGNGQTSSDSTQSVTYTNIGSYNIGLTVTMQNGCSYSVLNNNFIQINPVPTPSFTLSNATGCAPLAVNFTNQSYGATNYLWDFGNGQNSTISNPTFTYSTPGVYSVKLTSTNQFGCTAFQLSNGAVNVVAPVATFSASDTSGCPPLQVSFTNTSVGAASYLWLFGDGTVSTQANPVKNYQNLGTYTVKLIATSAGGCRDTLIMNNLIDVNFENAIYNPPPPITACVPFTTSFGIQDNSAISYLWNFGDGNTSTLPNPNHTYNEAGVYTVSLLINNGSVCSLNYPNFQTVIIEGGVPKFNVTIDPCPPFPVTFQDTTSVNIVSWQWNFGDGTTSTAETPTHIYANTNTHHASLTVTSNLGCTYTYIGFNSVNFSTFNAGFTTSYVQGSNPTIVNFTSTNQSATSWLWNFGDGNTSTLENPSHTYLTEGNFEITLQIGNSNCNSSGSSGDYFAESVAVLIAEADTIIPSTGGGSESAVLPNPLIGCAPLNISFYPQDTTHQVLIWNFGDGITSNEQNPSHLYTNTGIFNVSYVAITPTGIDTFQYLQSIKIGGGSTDFSLTQSQNCSFTTINVAVYDSAIVRSLTWDFGNGLTDSTNSSSFNFPLSSSAYNVVLTLIDTLGCQSSRLKSFFTNPAFPNVVYQHAVCKDTVSFTHDFPSNFTYLWNFGDSTSSSERFPQHFYNHAGVFSVSVQYTDPDGCTNTYILPDSIKVYFPISRIETIGPISGCAPFTANFVNLSTGAQSNMYAVYIWYWADGSYDHDNNLYGSNTYNYPGVYYASLLALNGEAGGCNSLDTINIPITVYGANANFDFTQTSTCFPLNAQFTDLSQEAVSWLWDFGNGITSTLSNPALTVTSELADSISLTITTSHGCVDSILKPGLSLFSPEIEADFSGNCNPLVVQFSASQDGIASWEWDFGDGTFSNEPEPSHTYTTNGNFIAKAVITSLDNCVDTVFLDLPINVTGPTAGFYSPTPASCAPSIVEFIDQSLEPVTWLWNFGDGTSSTIQNPIKLYDSPGTYDVSLAVTASNGCADTLLLIDYFTVLGPGTEFTASLSEACIGETIHFNDLSTGAVEWEWNFGEGTISTEQNPNFGFTQAGNYVITLFSRDSIGCSAFYTIPLPIEIHPFPIASFSVNNDASCTPLNINILNNSEGAVSYNWNLGNGETSILENPSTTYNIAGNYTIELIAINEGGCADTAFYDQINALLIPIAGFTLSETEGCTPLAVQFNNESYNLQNPSFSWNFGNGDVSQETNPIGVFYDPGFYSISLQVVNENGCGDTLLLPSIVNVFDTLPAPVTPILRVSVLDPSSVIVEWEESVAPDFGSYLIFRKNLISGEFDLIQTITDPHTLSYIDYSLNTLDNIYCYKLETYDRCGYSVQNEGLIVHCTINIEVNTREDNKIDVNWSPYVGKLPSQYRIFRTEENTVITEDLGTVSGIQTSFVDSSIFCPVKYKYSIRGEGLNGQWHVESNSDFDVSQPISNLFADQMVNAARSTVVSNQFVFTEWPVPEIMGSKVTGYKIYRSTDNLNFIYLGTVPSQQRSFLDENVNVNNTKYFYRIMATNQCNIEGKQGGFSDNVVLKAEATEEFTIRLNWTPYIGWGEQGVSFYVIEKQRADGTWEIIEQLPGAVTTTVDEN